jgi:acyl-coenzyme A thioesterase PaaI-like protein
VTAYHRLEDSLLIPSGIAHPPWSAAVQHGATLAGLMARAAEAVPTERPMQLVRLNVDLSRATPIGPTRVDTTVVRNGRRLQVIDIAVLVDDQLYSRGQALRIRTDDAVVAPADLPEPWVGDAATVTEPPPVSVPSPFGTSPFLQSMDMKWESWEPGRGVCWLHIGDQFVAGETTSPCVRAAIAADMVMTGGALLPIDRYHVVNADLGISFTRAPVGEHIRVSSVVRVDGQGFGMTDGVMHDRLGRFASVTKALLVDHLA